MDVGTIASWLWKLLPPAGVGGFMLRPRLQFSVNEDRCREEVSVDYPKGRYNQFSSTEITGKVITIPPTTFARKENSGLYIRAWVYNFGIYPATNCKVFLESVLFNGEVVESERSPLYWTDHKDRHEHSLSHGRRRGWYIDICASDEIDTRLRIISLKGLRGYHRFSGDGVYTMELSAESTWLTSPGFLRLKVRHDGRNWDKMEIISAEVGKKHFRWW